ncbi:hypothetical protein BDZ91DRAFT_729935 [Kalaharituber pfeilii]|nr:hypothetical protein BDZ91DRAFT_729935 [Kalaharituber pfeilii]
MSANIVFSCELPGTSLSGIAGRGRRPVELDETFLPRMGENPHLSTHSSHNQISGQQANRTDLCLGSSSCSVQRCKPDTCNRTGSCADGHVTSRTLSHDVGFSVPSPAQQSTSNPVCDRNLLLSVASATYSNAIPAGENSSIACSDAGATCSCRSGTKWAAIPAQTEISEIHKPRKLCGDSMHNHVLQLDRSGGREGCDYSNRSTSNSPLLDMCVDAGEGSCEVPVGAHRRTSISGTRSLPANIDVYDEEILANLPPGWSPGEYVQDFASVLERHPHKLLASLELKDLPNYDGLLRIQHASCGCWIYFHEDQQWGRFLALGVFPLEVIKNNWMLHRCWGDGDILPTISWVDMENAGQEHLTRVLQRK